MDFYKALRKRSAQQAHRILSQILRQRRTTKRIDAIRMGLRLAFENGVEWQIVHGSQIRR